MKIVFMGTPDFSAMVFNVLIKHFDVAAVVTGLDKAVGRKMTITPCALKVAAEKAGVPVYQYNKVSVEGIEEIRALSPDLVITAAFGQILSDEFLALPKLGVLNVHASLLPKYRGASPIQWSIINGDKETGITIMKTVKEVDAGDVLLQESCPIRDDDNAETLFDRLAELGGELISKAVALLESGNAVFVPQDHSLATHCSKISKEDGVINFNQTARQLDCFVRGMTPWPTAYTTLHGKLLKVFEVEKYDDEPLAPAGTVLDCEDGFIVASADGAVRLKTVQMEGRKVMDDLSFLNGYPELIAGDVLG